MRVSEQFVAALVDQAAFHRRSKAFSGGLAFPHAAAIGRLAALTGAASILDYGCGKGLQYEGEASLERGWGVPVSKYDPAWPPFAAEPEGQFDLVIVTHVLCWIPAEDMLGTLRRICGLARRAVYVGERIGPVKKVGVVRPSVTLAQGWDAVRWRSVLRAGRPPGLRLQLGLLAEQGDVVTVEEIA